MLATHLVSNDGCPTFRQMNHHLKSRSEFTNLKTKIAGGDQLNSITGGRSWPRIPKKDQGFTCLPCEIVPLYEE